MRGQYAELQVERFQADGLALSSESSGARIFVPWQLLGLAQAPECRNDSATLRWCIHCLDPESGTREFLVGGKNRWLLRACHGERLRHADRLRTGVLEIDTILERRALLSATLAFSRAPAPLRLHLGETLSICLEHRQPWDKGASCLCGRTVPRLLQESSRNCFGTAESYAARWGAMVELEAAASAVESGDSKFLCEVHVNWEASARRGSFNVPVSLARAHKLKFRGLVGRGGEKASAWLCMREAKSTEANAHGQRGQPWCGHAHVVQAGILGECAELGLDDEENLKNIDGRRSITVVFQVVEEVSDPGLPDGDFMLIECIQKALSHSMQHTAIGEVNAAPREDGKPIPALLARDIVLNRLPSTSSVDQADISQWKLNPSQDRGIRSALARPMMLVHGPPGTGKTRTAAVLMTLMAQRNLGSRCAMLFAAPTNRACDAALHCTNTLCEGHFAERLRARVEEDGDAECSICLEGNPNIVTACGHVFHSHCVALALQQSSRCPICRQMLKQQRGGLRMLRVYGADSEREDFPVPRRIDHKGIQTFKTQTVPVEMRRFTLHWRCHAAVEGEEPTAEAVKTREAYERLRATDVKSNSFDERRGEYYEALTKARAVEVHQSDIIFTTCVSARRMALLAALEEEGAPELRQVVLDEAGQAPEPEALCPLALARRARQVVLFGDHKQLRPILRSKIAEQAGLGISLFERLATRDWEGEAPVALLAQQYRMHPDISRFPSSRFYGGRVSDDPSVLRRERGLLAHPDTGESAACLLWDGRDGESQEQMQRVRTVGSGGVGSRSNTAEASRAAEVASMIAKAAGQASVAVLSWYNSQVAKVGDMLRRAGFPGVHVGSIATAQGSEWDYVILSAVRSGSGGSLGLLADANNLNVALTRARLGLLILCDAGALQRDRNWGVLVQDCQERDALIRCRPRVLPAPPGLVRKEREAPAVRKAPPAPPASLLPPAPAWLPPPPPLPVPSVLLPVPLAAPGLPLPPPPPPPPQSSFQPVLQQQISNLGMASLRNSLISSLDAQIAGMLNAQLQIGLSHGPGGNSTTPATPDALEPRCIFDSISVPAPVADASGQNRRIAVVEQPHAESCVRSPSPRRRPEQPREPGLQPRFNSPRRKASKNRRRRRSSSSSESSSTSRSSSSSDRCKRRRGETVRESKKVHAGSSSATSKSHVAAAPKVPRARNALFDVHLRSRQTSKERTSKESLERLQGA